VEIQVFDRQVVPESTDALEALNKYHAIEVVGEDGRKELLCKTSFLTKFAEYLSREYGLPKMGWKRLAEILGLRKTSREVGSRTVDNLLYAQFD
jgi:hypothetical protein